MQKEFINIAAHELRTPIQPIIGITGLIRKDLKDNKYKDLLDVLNRNVQRLKKLTEDVLDVIRIEGNSFNLYKDISK